MSTGTAGMNCSLGNLQSAMSEVGKNNRMNSVHSKHKYQDRYTMLDDQQMNIVRVKIARKAVKQTYSLMIDYTEVLC